MNGEQVVLDGYFTPKAFEPASFNEKDFESEYGALTLRMPKLTADEVTEIAGMVKKQRQMWLTNLKVAEVVDVLDIAVQKWLNPNDALRQLAETLLPVITGYDPEMIRLELKRFMRTFRKKELMRFLDEEFDNVAVLDDFRPRKTGGFSKATGPKLIFHVFSGNVPGVPVWSLVMGLLLKSGNIGKTSMAEPLLPVLFAQSIAEVSPELADCLAILPWKGGTNELEEAVISEAEAVVGYGSNESIEQVKSRVPVYKPFISYGHKVSFAMIGKEGLTPDHFNETVHRLAEDVSVYDQQSCLSPHAVFVEEGGSVSPRQAAQLLAKELQRYHEKRRRAMISGEEAFAIRKIRNQFEFTEADVYGSPEGTNWSVIYHHETGFLPSPLNRTVHVFRCGTLEEAIPVLRPYRPYLQTAGVAVGPNRLFRLAKQLSEEGLNRICSVGEMPRTTAGWHHDGKFNLLDLIRWTDIESSAEQNAERYDPDSE